jgi:ADP-ribose pyrophosphatase YjhB (NUDIX family)
MTCENPFKVLITTHLILIQGNDILLSLRQNTGYGDGLYSVITGKIDGQESATEATIREASEEAGITLLPQDVKFACAMHCLSGEGKEFIDLFFTATKWEGQVENVEPHKCSELKFFPRNALPQNMIAYVARGIECVLNNISYDEFGWELSLNSR